MTSCDQRNSWNKITIDNDAYMSSIRKKDNGFEICLTNLVELWMETLTGEDILKKCRELNPLLTVEHVDCHGTVSKMLHNMSEYIVEATVNHIQLHIDVAGIKMKFALNLTKASPYQFWKVVIKPLCLASTVLFHQRNILLDLVKKKDEEISEYKAQGAELLRKRIETKSFDEDQFKVDFPLGESIDCANTFQSMVQFCSKHNLCDEGVENSGESSSGSASHIDSKIRTNGKDKGDATPNQAESSKQTKAAQIVSNSKTKNSSKSDSAKQTDTKRSTTHMVHKRIKRPKTGLNGFIT